MPRVIREIQKAIEGDLYRIELKRQVEGGVAIEIEVREIDIVNGNPESSRARMFTNSDLTEGQRTSLRSLFNQIETRLKADRYT